MLSTPIGNDISGIKYGVKQLEGVWCHIEPVQEKTLNAPNWRIRLNSGYGGYLAMCALWTEASVVYQGKSAATLGSISASCYETAAVLLAEAIAAARTMGHDYLIGPLDGSTWFKHRLPVWTDGSPLFMLEDGLQPALQVAFEQGGFELIAKYYSSRGPLFVPGNKWVNEQIAAAGTSLADKDITVRSFYPHRFEEELLQIHKLCLASFAGNFLYTPISFIDFVALYKTYRDLLIPELILLAECKGQLAGVLFALPDLNNRGQVIIKTLVRHPDSYFRGLGQHLVEIFEEKAARLGYLSCVHAFMHADNVSLQISRHRALPCREYGLWGINL